MIRYALTCGCGHDFQAWFGSSSDYDDQAERGLVTCPACGGEDVRKQVMSPSIGRASRNEPGEGKSLAAFAKAVRSHIRENFENVGARFPEEVRKIHYGERETANVYGEASNDDVRELTEEGIEVSPLPGPFAPDADKKLN